MRIRLLCRIALATAVTLLSTAFMHAQDTASLTGTVRDPTGAVVPWRAGCRRQYPTRR